MLVLCSIVFGLTFSTIIAVAVLIDNDFKLGADIWWTILFFNPVISVLGLILLLGVLPLKVHERIDEVIMGRKVLMWTCILCAFGLGVLVSSFLIWG